MSETAWTAMDAAHWPDPAHGRLDDEGDEERDEIGELIARVRKDRADG